jgi:hypothetical protein
MHFLLRKDDIPVAEACSSFQARRRARCRRFLLPPLRPVSAFFGSSARGTCRQRRHLGRGRRDMAGRDARRSTDRPTRAGALSAPQACLLRLRPSAANSRRHQRPGAPSAAARPALLNVPSHPRSPSVAGDGISLTLRLGRKPINGVAGRLGPPAVRSCHMR